MFIRLAITSPEVNGFGWNLGNSEYIVWSWPWQILGAIRAEARAGALAEVFFYQVDNARLCRFPVSRISRNLHTRPGSVWFLCSFRIIFWKFAHKRSFFPKNLQFCLIRVNDFRLQVAISPKLLQILENHGRLARPCNVDFPFTPFQLNLHT